MLTYTPLRRSSRRYQTGLSLIEIMISLAIALFLLLGISTFFLDLAKTQTFTQRASVLNGEMDAIAQLINQDVKRAGYSPFTSSSSADRMGVFVDDTKNCLVYAYRTDVTGCKVRESGFKLSTETPPRLLMRTSAAYNVSSCDVSGYPVNNYNSAGVCNACNNPGSAGAACQDWSPLTQSSEILIDASSFQFNYTPKGGNYTKANIKVHIEVSAARDASIKRQINLQLVPWN